MPQSTGITVESKWTVQGDLNKKYLERKKVQYIEDDSDSSDSDIDLCGMEYLNESNEETKNVAKDSLVELNIKI